MCVSCTALRSCSLLTVKLRLGCVGAGEGAAALLLRREEAEGAREVVAEAEGARGRWEVVPTLRGEEEEGGGGGEVSGGAPALGWGVAPTLSM